MPKLNDGITRVAAHVIVSRPGRAREDDSVYTWMDVTGDDDSVIGAIEIKSNGNVDIRVGNNPTSDYVISFSSAELWRIANKAVELFCDGE